MRLSISIQQFVLLTVASLAANAQPVNRTGGCRSGAAFRPSPSPIDIADGQTPLKDLWRILGIPAKLRPASSSVFLAAPREIDCTTGCNARIVNSPPLLADGYESIVRVCRHFKQTCRFLLLHQSAAGWSLVDYLDSPFEKYEAPKVWVESAQDRRWLVKRGFGGGGTGAYLAVAEWFELRCGALQQVLTLPAGGDDVNAKPARSFSARFRAFHRQGSRESLEFGYVVLFQDYEDERELWQEERTVVFSRTDTNAPFVFDPVASTISAAFKAKVFAIYSMDRNDFVEFAYDRLLRIARDAADPRRDWLRRLLGETQESPKVNALEALLDDHKPILKGRNP